jgi:phosphonatase-like hydrolase
MTIDLAVFDLAGTTVEERGAVYDVLAATVRTHGGDPSPSDVQQWMGADKRTAIAALVGGRGDVDAAFADFRGRLQQEYAQRPPRPMPGVLDLFARLREDDVQIALTTGFERDVTALVLDAVGWTEGIVDAVICTEDVTLGRPAPFMVFRAMERTGRTDVRRVLVAGDTPRDVEAGLNAGAGRVVRGAQRRARRLGTGDRPTGGGRRERGRTVHVRVVRCEHSAGARVPASLLESPMRRSVCLAFAAVLAAGVLVAAPAGASAPIRLGPGVTLQHATFKFHGPQSVYTLDVRLSGHTRLVSTAPKRRIGAMRVDMVRLARQEGAIAGINGDTLYFADPTSQPRAGVAYNGRTLKSPLQGQNAVLYTTTSNHANIGNVSFGGTFKWNTPSDRYGRSWHLGGNIHTYNSLENAKNGGVTFTDSNLLTRSSLRSIGNASQRHVTPKCTRVDLRPLEITHTATGTSGRYVVTGYHTNVSRYARDAAGRNALLTCGADQKRYLDTRKVRPGLTLSIAVGYKVPHIVSLISGVRKLISGGKAFNDKSGLNELGSQQTAESFACVLKGGTRVLLGAVEGKKRGANGMTYAQLTSYLLARHCWTAMAMQGSTDTQLVAKRPHGTLAFQNRLNNKAGNKPNAPVDGLVVVTD